MSAETKGTPERNPSTIANRGMPSTGSVPIVVSRSPKSSAMIPRVSESPDSVEIRLRPSTVMAKYSAGPKASANLVIQLTVKISRIVLRTEPTAEPRMDNVSAWPASPFWRIG